MTTAVQTDVLMPQMGVTVFEATVTTWLKQEGDTVAYDEPLLMIATDKVDTEVPSPADGVLVKIFTGEGETVAVGSRIGLIAPAGADVSIDVTRPLPEAPPDTADDTGSAAGAPGGRGKLRRSAENGARSLISPIVGRIAAELGIDPAAIEGTGRGGRVTKRDILAYAPTPAAASPAAEAHASPAPPQPVGHRLETEEPASQMRRLIAEHMRRSLDTSAHLTTVFEVDMAQVAEIRESLKRDFQQYGVRLTYLPFIARATIEALRSWPWLNGEIRGDKIVTKHYVNLGIAVALDGGKGLVVPVVKDADQLNLLGLARSIADVAERARTKQLTPDDLQNGSFTLTNPGGFGSILGTPIINQPQVGILDIEAVVKRIVVVTDERGRDSTAIRPMMNLCLSFDHRLIDGAYAAQFLRDVKRNLESWDASAY